MGTRQTSFSRFIRLISPIRRRLIRLISPIPPIRLIRLISLIGLIILVSVSFLLLTSKESSAGWYDDNWLYRTAYSIGNTGSADSDKKVLISVGTDTLITNSKLQSDCGDSRFTDATGKVLKYFIDVSGGAGVGCNDASSDYYVLMESIPAGGSIIYHYYGNTNASNGTQPSQFSQSTFTPNSGPTAASEEQSPGPVASWSFDEGTGTTAEDDTSGGNDGTLFNSPTWKTESDCISGKCLFFDGSDDYVIKTYASDTDLDPGTGSLTISTWVKHTSSQSGTDVIMSRVDGSDGDGVGYKLYMDSSGYICFGIDQTAGSFPVDSACSGATQGSYADSKWHFVSGVKSGTSSVTLYVDGQQIAQDASITSSSISGSSPGLRVGIDNGSSNPWTGFIDEVRIYPYARTAAQIRSDYAARGSIKGVAAQFGAGGPGSGEKLSNGLVGYWKMDDSGVDVEGETITDSSGNNNTGTLYGDNSTGDNGTGMDCTVTGKFNTGCDFDGTDDVVTSTGYDLTTAYSWCMWVNSDTTVGTGYDLPLINGVTNDSWGFSWDNDDSNFQQSVYQRKNDDSYVSAKLTSTLAADTWNFICGTWDGTNLKAYLNGNSEATTAISTVKTLSGALEIGGGSSGNPFDGSLDDLRVYSRALSPAEVRALYNWAPGPVAHWKLDENTGTAAYDTSTNGYTGTLINTPSWVPAKIGAGIAFDATSDRRIYATNVLPTGDFTYSFWAYIKSTGSRDETLLGAENSTAGGDGDEFLIAFTGGTTLQFALNGALVANWGDPASNTWYHFTAVRSGSAISLYQNSLLIDTGTDGTALSFDSGCNLYFGIDPRAGCDETGNTFGSSSNAIIDDVRIYNYARTPAQIIEDMNGGHPLGGSPVGSQVAYWKFDEGYGDTANDSSPQNNDGDLAGTGTTCPQAADSACPGWSNLGKFGKALDFEDSGTTDDYVHIPDAASLTFTNQLSFGSWFQLESDSSWQTLIHGNNDGLGYDSSYSLLVYGAGDSIQCNFGNLGENSGNISYTLTTGVWYHIICTYDGAQGKVYLNGKLISTWTATSSISNTSGVTIGRASDGNFYFDGLIDEVKIYAAPLTADQVLIEYNRGKAAVMGSTSTSSDGITADNSSAREYCIPGDTTSCSAPVAEWKMDENTGTSTVADSSGNGFDATMNIYSNSDWVPGKFGSGLKTDGQNYSTKYLSYADTGSSALDITGSFTLSAWVKMDPGETEASVIIKGVPTVNNENYGMHITSNNLLGEYTFLSDYAYLQGSTTISTNQWTYLTVVFDDPGDKFILYVNGVLDSSGGTNTNQSLTANDGVLKIGGDLSPGQIDNIRIYNYARTPAQIAWEYNRGAPIAHYQFDECQGSTAFNASLNANGQAAGSNGIISAGDTSGSNDSVGTCTGSAGEMWKDGATGKINSSLEFDGTNDYVEITDTANLRFDASTSDFSIFAWVKRTTTGTEYIISKEDADDDGYRLQFNSSNQVLCSEDATDVTSTTSISDTNWHHVGCTIDRDGNGQVYIDGKQDGTATSMGTDAMATTSNVRFASRSYTPTSFFAGQLDDVRIYNYALTAAQIKDLYNNGAVSFK